MKHRRGQGEEQAQIKLSGTMTKSTPQNWWVQETTLSASNLVSTRSYGSRCCQHPPFLQPQWPPASHLLLHQKLDMATSVILKSWVLPILNSIIGSAFLKLTTFKLNSHMKSLIGRGWLTCLYSCYKETWRMSSLPRQNS